MLTALALSRDPSLTEGLKEIRADILIGKLASREQVGEALRKAVQSGKISREALDKFLSDSGCSENELAKSLLIEGALANSGVTVENDRKQNFCYLPNRNILWNANFCQLQNT